MCACMFHVYVYVCVCLEPWKAWGNPCLVCADIHTYIHTRICACIHALSYCCAQAHKINIHTYIHVYIHTCIYTYIPALSYCWHKLMRCEANSSGCLVMSKIECLIISIMITWKRGMNSSIDICMYVCMYIRMCVCNAWSITWKRGINSSIDICMYVCMCVCNVWSSRSWLRGKEAWTRRWIPVCMYVCMYVCM